MDAEERERYGKDVGWSLMDAVEAGVFPKTMPGMRRKRSVGTSTAEMERRRRAKEDARKKAYGTPTIVTRYTVADAAYLPP